MMKKLCRCKILLTEHPADVGETYLEHFFCASRMAKESAKISGIMMLHAICPFIYKDEAGERVKKLNYKIQKRQEALAQCLKKDKIDE